MIVVEYMKLYDKELNNMLFPGTGCDHMHAAQNSKEKVKEDVIELDESIWIIGQR